MFVITDKATSDQEREWALKNLELSTRRIGDATGSKPVPDYLRQSLLTKAEGCP